jgi:hypothetical protein
MQLEINAIQLWPVEVFLTLRVTVAATLWKVVLIAMMTLFKYCCTPP